MGLLALFSKPVHGLMKLPSGSFTIDAAGAVLVSTLPSNFPPTLVKEIADQVELLVWFFAQFITESPPLASTLPQTNASSQA